MTISKYPWLKLIIAIIAAVVVGIILDSWGWGIATFFILMFIFIWVASWIFGGDIKGKVEVTDELEELLNKLEIIGDIKNALPPNARGWCNSLGLYVQLREFSRGMTDMSRLQAGDKNYSQVDAWKDNYSIEFDAKWKVKKYDSGDWEKLVDPTFDIANWISTYGGLPVEYVDSFNRAIEAFKQEGHLELPPQVNMDAIDADRVVEETQSLSNGEDMDKAQVSRAEVLEEMFKLRDTLSVGLIPAKKGFTNAEANVIIYKVNPLVVRAFPVKEEASKDKIDEWLKHPRINCPLPDQFIMSAASSTPMPVEMAERILRRLLEDKYDTCYGLAEERVRSGK